MYSYHTCLLLFWSSTGKNWASTPSVGHGNRPRVWLRLRLMRLILVGVHMFLQAPIPPIYKIPGFIYRFNNCLTTTSNYEQFEKQYLG
jgi:hypothetical protein